MADQFESVNEEQEETQKVVQRLQERARKASQDIDTKKRLIEREIEEARYQRRYGVPPIVFTVIFVLGWLVLAFISLGVIGSVIWSYLAHGGAELPETLTNWGGVIIGFYFGHFFSFLRDAYPKEKERTD